jgi:hypothetical protein
VGGAVEREEDRLPRLGAVEMTVSGVEAQWRGRHGGERSHRGDAAERGSERCCGAAVR